MLTKPAATVIAFILGLFSFFLFFLVGESMKSGRAAWLVVAVFCLCSEFFICRMPGALRALWFTGLILNLPLWAAFAFGEPGQFRTNFPGLAAALLCTCLGALAGEVVPRRAAKMQ